MKNFYPVRFCNANDDNKVSYKSRKVFIIKCFSYKISSHYRYLIPEVVFPAEKTIPTIAVPVLEGFFAFLIYVGNTINL